MTTPTASRLTALTVAAGIAALSLLAAACGELTTAPGGPTTADSISYDLPLDVRFVGTVPADVQQAALAAAARWKQVVRGPWTTVTPPAGGAPCDFAPALTTPVPSMVVYVRMSAPDSLQGYAANGGACAVRPGTLLTYEGIVTVSTPNIDITRQNGTLGVTVAHEFGHVMGIGSNWQASSYLLDGNGPNPAFAGPAAMQAAFDVGATASASTPVQIAHPGESGAYAHWRTPGTGNEIMRSGGGTAISKITLGALQDLGYVVDMTKADTFVP
jgi:hypothetical protein